MEPSVTILLVEDDPLVQDVSRLALEDGGYAVLPANSGDEAIHFIWHSDQPLSGLVTDVQLGSGPSGWDVARAGRERDPELPVVYMTGDSAHEWAAHGVPKSILLQKPVATAQLVTAISTLLNKVDSNPHLPAA
jgi:CheY-like chemotaxis protein